MDLPFPFDLATRASNLFERVRILRLLEKEAAWEPTTASGALTAFDEWKIDRCARRLAGQLADDPVLDADIPTEKDGLAAVLHSYRRWELSGASLSPTGRETLSKVHQEWLPTYARALARFDEDAADAEGAGWREPDTYYGRFARVCEPFLLHLRRELDAAQTAANDGSGGARWSGQFVDGFLTHFLDRFDLALAWAIEADMNVYCAREGIDKARATRVEYLRYFDLRFATADSYNRFYLTFPVLGRWLAQVTRLMCDNGLAIIERLQRDERELSEVILPRPISEFAALQLGRSDCHAGGQTVAFVEVALASGDRTTFVYKPRSLEFESAMQKLLGRLNHRGVLPFREHRVLDKGGYGYEELIPSGRNRVESAAEVESIYEELGGYLGIFHVLGGSDLHYENILVADGHAFVCDCETVLGVRLAGQDRTLGTVLDSVYKTGLLEWPAGAKADGDLAMRISGYAGGEAYELPMAAPRVTGERMSFERSVRHQVGVRIDPDASNRVYLSDQLVSPIDYKHAILRGFARVHEWFEGSKFEAAAWVSELFQHAPVRFVNWATQIYVQLLVGARHPKCLMEPLEVDLVFNRLRQHPRQWDRERRLAQRDVASLWRLDVPIFTARAGEQRLLWDHREEVPLPLEATPLDDAGERITSLTPDNYRHQAQYISASLASSEVRSPEFVSAALEYARKVGLKLCSLLQDPGDGSPWRSYVIGSASYREAEILSDLYNGTAGVALFLAYLDSVAPDERFRAAADQALAHAIASHVQDEVGAFQGIGGMIYLLTHLHHLWDDGSLLDRAVELSEAAHHLVPDDRHYDVLSGAAGLIPVLIGLAEARPGAGVDVAHACARHLLRHAQREEKGLSWPLATPSDGVANLTGFAHGATGIGWALIQLGCQADDEAYVAAGCDAFAYERLHFDDDKQDWYDLRTSVIAMNSGRRTFSNAWCNGAAGIGLGRIASWARLGEQDDELLREAYAALAATVRNFHRIGNDTLCHGRSGNAELFLRFALLKDEPAFQLEANLQAQAQWQSMEEDQSLLVSTQGVRVFPGLMLGLAGFGMHFLRLAYPDRIPSPLLLDSFPGSR